MTHFAIVDIPLHAQGPLTLFAKIPFCPMILLLNKFMHMLVLSYDSVVKQIHAYVSSVSINFLELHLLSL